MRIPARARPTGSGNGHVAGGVGVGRGGGGASLLAAVIITFPIVRMERPPSRRFGIFIRTSPISSQSGVRSFIMYVFN